MADTKNGDSYEPISANFNEKKNMVKYAGHVYVNKAWKTWCWVLLIIFIIIPAAIGIIVIVTAGVAFGTSAKNAGVALEETAEEIKI
jgi:hypothetical protein